MSIARIRNDSWKDDENLKEVLTDYVSKTFKKCEILDFVKRDFPQYAWSPSSLSRRLNHFRIQYTDYNVPVDVIQGIVSNEMGGPGALLGYRAMHQKIRQEYKLNVPRAVVHGAMFNENPELLEARRPGAKKKEKGHFSSPGPNFVHSLDGHDKLMGYQNSTFPIAIYGSIDTCSRKILWLKVWSSNSNPDLIGRFYIEYLYKSKVVAQNLRIDKGTETVQMAGVHCYLLKDKVDDPTKNIIFGPSTSNQIERWWKELHEKLEEYYKDQLRTMKDNLMYDPKNELHREILAYVMVPIIQHQVDVFVELWNNHRIRKQKETYLPTGKPSHIYSFPENWGLQ
ncbi:uncharacterized protein [Clytia hemisphaerica]|uniref:uncharacterized protein n=1 Tax=Clytia hemisphaerica TaxID=252671 RepID=UPI0034D4C8E5